MTKGKLIVIEGSDGAGKKTQLDLLAKKLRRFKKPVKTFDFPNYQRFFGVLIAEYLRGELGRLRANHPKLVCLAYALDRWQDSFQIKKYLDRGYIVISNRYTTANLGYQLANVESNKRKELKKWIEQLEYQKLNIPKPDQVIFLYIPAKIGQRLVDKKTKSRNYSDKRDIHEKNSRYLETANQVFSQLCQQKEWRQIDCLENAKLLSPNEIHKKVWKKVKNLIK